MQISNLTSRQQEEFEHSTQLSRQKYNQQQSQQPLAHQQQLQQVVPPITGAEEMLWKDFSASFRRRNNKIG